MAAKIIIVIIVLVIILILNIFLKMGGYSYNARKYGVITKATVVGYYVSYDSDNFMWFPVVKFQNMNGLELIVRSYCKLALPVYKVGDVVKIEYYSDDFYSCETKEVFTNVLAGKKEEMKINSKVVFNFLDIKHLLDTVIEMIFVAVALLMLL